MKKLLLLLGVAILLSSALVLVSCQVGTSCHGKMGCIRENQYKEDPPKTLQSKDCGYYYCKVVKNRGKNGLFKCDCD